MIKPLLTYYKLAFTLSMLCLAFSVDGFSQSQEVDTSYGKAKAIAPSTVKQQKIDFETAVPMPAPAELRTKSIEELKELAITKFNKISLLTGVYLTEEQSQAKALQVEAMSKSELISEVSYETIKTKK